MSLAAKLIHLGFVPEVDFSAKNRHGVEWFDWLAQTAPPTAAALDAILPEHLAASAIARENAATAALATAPGRSTKLLRAFMLVMLDELNAHALKHNAILDAVDAATNLADLKSRIAAINDYPQRSKAQLINAIKSHIDAGNAE